MAKRATLKQAKKQEALVTIERLLQEVSTTTEEAGRLLILKTRRTAQRGNIRLTKEQRRLFCNYCNSFLRTGTNSTTRTREGKIVIICHHCKHITRIPLRKNRTTTLPTKNSPKHL